MSRPILVAWARHSKRCACIDHIKTTEEYMDATLSARLAGPDPKDTSISKRRWEKEIGRWRELMRSSVADHDVLTEPIRPPPGLARPSFGSLIRLYTESDAALV